VKNIKKQPSRDLQYAREVAQEKLAMVRARQEKSKNPDTFKKVIESLEEHITEINTELASR
jgi:hypothetical protein